MEIKHIVLIVKSLEKSIEFYNKLGFELNSQEEGFAEFKAGNVNLALLNEKLASDLAGEERINFNEKKDFIIGIEVKDIDKKVEELKANSLAFIKEPKTKPWGQRTAYLKDPDNNLIEISSWVKKS